VTTTSAAASGATRRLASGVSLVVSSIVPPLVARGCGAHAAPTAASTPPPPPGPPDRARFGCAGWLAPLAGGRGRGGKLPVEPAAADLGETGRPAVVRTRPGTDALGTDPKEPAS